MFVLGQFWLSEGDKGRWKSLVYRFFAHESGRDRGRWQERRGVWEAWCLGFVRGLLTASSILTNPVN